MMDAQTTELAYLNWSKLSKFLQLNNQAIVILSPKVKTETLIITNKINRETWTMEQTGSLTVTYIKGLATELQGYDGILTSSISNTYLHPSWRFASKLFGFPDDLLALGKQADISFEIFGTSEMAILLRLACKLTETRIPVKAIDAPLTPSTSSTTVSSVYATLVESATAIQHTNRILLFDRCDNLLYMSCLNQERSSTNARIFTFGQASLAESITPALEVYPKNTGGFITTDIRNILHNPDILDRMVEFVQKTNDLLLGECQLIIHPEHLQQIMRLGTGTP
ncbi:hypothetical protein BC941DRAFT_21853 [Chlamydoabsidia padenii]|nr:hypothetical protein BC941DRAFT_21853 [Chlamydoabsidia padenii]